MDKIQISKANSLAKCLISSPVNLDSETFIGANGLIVVEPCLWEEEKAPILNVPQVSLRARVIVKDDGNLLIRPYADGSKPRRFEELFHTEHCKVRRSGSGAITEHWHFPARLTPSEVYEVRMREQRLIDSYFLVGKEGAWKARA